MHIEINLIPTPDGTVVADLKIRSRPNGPLLKRTQVGGLSPEDAEQVTIKATSDGKLGVLGSGG